MQKKINAALFTKTPALLLLLSLPSLALSQAALMQQGNLLHDQAQFSIKPGIPIGQLPGVSNNTVLLKKIGGRNGIADIQSLSVDKMRVKKGQTIWSLSEENGFKPNSDLMNAVRALNPEKDIDRIQAGEELLIPKVVKKKPQDRSAYILYDRDWRKKSRYGDALMLAFSNQSPAVNGGGYAENGVKLASSLSMLEDNQSSIPGDVLNQVRMDAAIATYIAQESGGIKNTSGQGGHFPDLPSDLKSKISTLSADDRKNLYDNVTSSVNQTAYRFKNGISDRVDVTVDTITEGEGKSLCRVSVYSITAVEYILEQFHKKVRLLNLSTPAKGPVTKSRRVFWAEWQGDIVSAYQQVNLTHDEENARFELLVNNGGQCS